MKVPGCALKDITPAHFFDGGPLASCRMEVQLWASYRAQHLARTVRGTRSPLQTTSSLFLNHPLALACSCQDLALAR